MFSSLLAPANSSTIVSRIHCTTRPSEAGRQGRPGPPHLSRQFFFRRPFNFAGGRERGARCYELRTLLLLVMPATNAGSERSFSAVRRIKTYLRSTMTQQRLTDHLMLLHVHKSHTDSLNLVDVANDFIAGNDHRKNMFGTEFKPSDLI